MNPAATLMRPDREAGFTLAEVLVTLGLLGLFAVLLTGALGGTVRAGQSLAQPAGDGGIAAAQRVLRARLEHTTPVVRTDSIDPIVDLRGDARRLSFTAPPPDRQDPDALQLYRLTLTPAGDLVLYSASSLNSRIDLSDPALTGWQGTRLLSDVAELELSYFGPDRFVASERWQTVWMQRQQLPALIRVRLRFAEGDRRFWPDLVVRPGATVNTACRIQRATGRCEAI